jgi:ADP-heptose:LPS heptosyltransferase
LSRFQKLKIFIKIIEVFFKDPSLFISFCRNAVHVFFKKIILSFTKKEWLVISLTEHIGDITAAEPILKFLHEKYPKAQITRVIDKNYKELVASHPCIDDIITVSCFTEWILLRKLIPEKFLFDLHLHNKVCDKHGFAYKRKGIIDINNENYYEKGNLLYCFSRSGGISINDKIAPQLFLNCINKQLPDQPYIVIHTSSNNSKRNWNNESWHQLVEYVFINYAGIKIIEIGFQPKIESASSLYLNHCGKKDFFFIATLIRHSSLFIGIDSGFAHFANALNKEAMILIGAYNGFVNYMPYSGKYMIESTEQIFYFEEELTYLKFEAVKNMLNKKLKMI